MDTKTLSAYEKNKPAIYRWRELNKEKYNDICNKAQTIYYILLGDIISPRYHLLGVSKIKNTNGISRVL